MVDAARMIARSQVGELAGCVACDQPSKLYFNLCSGSYDNAGLVGFGLCAVCLHEKNMNEIVSVIAVRMLAGSDEVIQ